MGEILQNSRFSSSEYLRQMRLQLFNFIFKAFIYFIYLLIMILSVALIYSYHSSHADTQQKTLMAETKMQTGNQN